VKWLLGKGQDLSINDEAHAQFSFVQYFRPGDARVQVMQLLAYDGDKAPQRSKDPVCIADT
jgi:hypothetical protein